MPEAVRLVNILIGNYTVDCTLGTRVQIYFGIVQSTV